MDKSTNFKNHPKPRGKDVPYHQYPPEGTAVRVNNTDMVPFSNITYQTNTPSINNNNPQMPKTITTPPSQPKNLSHSIHDKPTKPTCVSNLPPSNPSLSSPRAVGGLNVDIFYDGSSSEPQPHIMGGDGLVRPSSCDACTLGRQVSHVCYQHSKALSSLSFERDKEGNRTVQQPHMDVVDIPSSPDELPNYDHPLLL
ncbi:hypothetical protein FXO38_10754 [Capsicum annuum]|nr:hypothetical protein FXO37_15745 [Capsicum annuum]KAF3663210.1 hypothetical protein FXO38_10754 [Capsicum annuum]